MEQQDQQSTAVPGSTQSLDVNMLLTQYGQAMARAEQLEQLCSTQEQRLAELERQLQAAESARKSDPQSQPGPNVEADLRRKNETIESLRLQLMTAQSEITRLKEKLKLAAEGSYTLRRRRYRRWWQFWK